MIKAEVIQGKELLLPTEERRRCSMKTCDSTSSGLYNDRRTNRCSKPAIILLDNIPFCTLHAGKISLSYILKQQENK